MAAATDVKGPTMAPTGLAAVPAEVTNTSVTLKWVCVCAPHHGYVLEYAVNSRLSPWTPVTREIAVQSNPESKATSFFALLDDSAGGGGAEDGLQMLPEGVLAPPNVFTSTSITITGLREATEYVFRVAAVLVVPGSPVRVLPEARVWSETSAPVTTLTLKAEADRLRASVAPLHTEISKLRDEIFRLQTELTQKTERIGHLDAVNRERLVNIDQLSQARQRIEQLGAEKRSLQANIADKDARLGVIERELRASESKIKDLEATVSSERAARQSLEGRIVAGGSEGAELTSALRAELDTALQAVEAARAEERGLRASLDEARRETTAALDAAAAARADAERAAQVAELASAEAVERARAEAFEAAATPLRAQLVALRAELETAAQTSAQVADLQEKLAAARAEASAAASRVEGLEANLAEARERADGLSSESQLRAALSSELDSLRSELEQARGRISTLEGEKAAVSMEASTTAHELKQLQHDLEAARAQLEAANGSVSTLTAELEHARTAQAEAESAAVKATALADSLRSELRTAESTTAVTQAQLTAESERLAAVEAALEEVRVAKAGAESRAAELEQRMGGLEGDAVLSQSRLREVEDALRASRESAQQHTDAAREGAQVAEERIADLESRLKRSTEAEETARRASAAELEATRASYERQMRELSERMAATGEKAEEATALRQQIASLSTFLSGRDAELASLRQQLDEALALRPQLVELHTQLNRVQLEHDAKARKVAQQEDHLAELRERILYLERQHETCADPVVVARLDQEARAARADLAERAVVLSLKEERVAYLEQINERLETDNAQLNVSVADLRGRIADLEAMLQALQAGAPVAATPPLPLPVSPGYHPAAAAPHAPHHASAAVPAPVPAPSVPAAASGAAPSGDLSAEDAAYFGQQLTAGSARYTIAVQLRQMGQSRSRSLQAARMFDDVNAALDWLHAHA